MNEQDGPSTGELAMRGNVISAQELIDLRDNLNGAETSSGGAVVGPKATKHRRPALKVGLESEDGRSYLALTDHDTGHRATLRLSLESMAALGAQMLTTSAGDGITLCCWLEGELEVAK